MTQGTGTNRFELFFARIGRRGAWALAVAVMVVFALVAEVGAEIAVLAYWRAKGTATDKLVDMGRQTLILGRLGVFGYPDLLRPTLHYVGNARLSGDSRDWSPADPILGWRFSNDALATDDVEQTGRLVQYVTTPQGFKSLDGSSPVYARPKPAGVLRIIVLGGSTVAGDYSDAPTDTLPSHLAGLLKTAAGGKSIELINAGISGFSSAQELLYLLTELVSYQPDLVIAYDGWNDLAVTNRLLQQTGDEISVFRSDIINQYTERLNQSFTVSGSAALLLRAALAEVHNQAKRGGLAMALDLLRQKIGLTFRQPSDNSAMAADPRTIRHYGNIHRAMVALAGINGFSIALFLQPVMGIDDKPYSAAEQVIFRTLGPEAAALRKTLFDGFAGALRHIEAEQGNRPGLCVGDLRDSFVGVTEPMYLDSGHLLAAGNALMAKRIADRLRACRLL